MIAASADSREVICGTNDGSLYLVNIDTNACSLIANTGGRPLGLELCKDGSLIVCDSFAGLLKYRRASSGNDSAPAGSIAFDPKPEVLASHVNAQPLKFCSNASESPDGSIWFTESTSRFHYPEFMGAILEHAPRGSLNVWRPNGEVKRVLDGRYFANGVVAEPNGDGVLFCETTDYAVRRWHIPSQSVTDLAENLPGFPDNASALTPTGRDGLSEIWITYAHPRSLPLDLLAKFPGIIRHIAWNLPDAIRPGPGHEVWAAQWLYDDVIGWRQGQQIRGTHPAFHTATGAVRIGNELILASKDQSILLAVSLDS